jgi:hypothetical protein
MFCAIALLIAPSLFQGFDAPQRQALVAQGQLWSTITVNRPVFHEGRLQGEARKPGIAGEVLEHLMVHFAVVNDGDKTINPALESTQFLVNGKPLEGWPWIINNGPRDERFFALPPGDNIVFSLAMGKQFEKPGVYRISWKGKGFQSPEIVFRVLPKDKH